MRKAENLKLKISRETLKRLDVKELANIQGGSCCGPCQVNTSRNCMD